jgi:hypothetical protein
MKKVNQECYVYVSRNGKEYISKEDCLKADEEYDRLKREFLISDMAKNIKTIYTCGCINGGDWLECKFINSKREAYVIEKYKKESNVNVGEWFCVLDSSVLGEKDIGKRFTQEEAIAIQVQEIIRLMRFRKEKMQTLNSAIASIEENMLCER